MMWHIGIWLSFVAFNLHCVEKNPKSITKQVTLECNGSGYPTTKAIKGLVLAYYFHQNPAYKISVKKIQGGLYSQRLYVATIKQEGQKIPLFFFKISKKTGSTKNLLEIQNGTIGQKINDFLNSKESSSISKKNFPEIMFLKNVFNYTDQYGFTRSIEVTPSAQGLLLQDILETENHDAVKQSSYALGKALAAFHQLFMDYHDSQDPDDWETIGHGDFGIKNVLFNPITNKISFIDNEGMKPHKINHDIETMTTSLIMFQYLTRHYKTRWTVYLDHCISFLKGYIESYPPEKRTYLATHLEQTLEKSMLKSLGKRFVQCLFFTEKTFNEQEFKITINRCLQKFKK